MKKDFSALVLIGFKRSVSVTRIINNSIVLRKEKSQFLENIFQLLVFENHELQRYSNLF